MDAPAYPIPAIRLPLISLLTQYYTGADELTSGQPVDLPHDLLSIMDLVVMFLEFARETEAAYGVDFTEFLRRQALAAYAPDGKPSPGIT